MGPIQLADTMAVAGHPRGQAVRAWRRRGGSGAGRHGSIVAALRTDMPARYLPLKHDNFEGTAISISHDEGATWSPLNFVLGLGRQHATLARLPNDDLVMTFIRRLDLDEGTLASYRRGCDAVVSHDHGVSWEVDRTYVLDEFSAIYTRPRRTGDALNMWFGTVCGHQFSIALDDGSMLTTYGNYRNAGVLIRWKL